MADSRSWAVTGVHGAETRMRLANPGTGEPPLPRPHERIIVVEVGSWRAVWLAIRAALSATDTER
jgi:hypothetical protein